MTIRIPGVKYTAYTSRNMRTDLLDRCRIIAAVEHTTLEDVLNRAVALGLDAIETRLSEREHATAV